MITKYSVAAVTAVDMDIWPGSSDYRYRYRSEAIRDPLTRSPRIWLIKIRRYEIVIL